MAGEQADECADDDEVVRFLLVKDDHDNRDKQRGVDNPEEEEQLQQGRREQKGQPKGDGANDHRQDVTQAEFQRLARVRAKQQWASACRHLRGSP